MICVILMLSRFENTELFLIYIILVIYIQTLMTKNFSFSSEDM